MSVLDESSPFPIYRKYAAVDSGDGNSGGPKGTLRENHVVACVAFGDLKGTVGGPVPSRPSAFGALLIAVSNRLCKIL